MSPSPSLPGQIARLLWARSSEFGQLPPGQLYRQKDRPQPVESTCLWEGNLPVNIQRYRWGSLL